MKTTEQQMEEQRIAEAFQKECHEMADTVILIAKERGNPNMSTQDATNVWLFYKLAELQMRITKLESYNPAY